MRTTLEIDDDVRSAAKELAARQPSYPGSPFPVRENVDRLAEASSVNHAFWPDDLNTVTSLVFDWQHVLGHRQLTNIYLLRLAVQNEGRFVSFVARVNLQSVRGATPAHYVGQFVS